MKNANIILSCLISILSFSCSNNEKPSPEKIEYGKFKGNIGRHGYDLINNESNQRISTIHFDTKSIQFQFSSDLSSTMINGSVFDVRQRLAVNLVNPLNTSSFPFFETYKKSTNYNENWISVNWVEQSGNKNTNNLYISLKEKRAIAAEIISVNYKELKVPSFDIKIKGYLYNFDNKKDSILIDVAITTQASTE